MRPHLTVIVMILGVGVLLLLTRSCQEYNHRRQVRLGSEQSVDKGITCYRLVTATRFCRYASFPK